MFFPPFLGSKHKFKNWGHIPRIQSYHKQYFCWTFFRVEMCQSFQCSPKTFERLTSTCNAFCPSTKRFTTKPKLQLFPCMEVFQSDLALTLGSRSILEISRMWSRFERQPWLPWKAWFRVTKRYLEMFLVPSKKELILWKTHFWNITTSLSERLLMASTKLSDFKST